MNPYSLPPLLSAFIIFVLGLATYRLNKTSAFHKAFFYFCMTSVVWLGGMGFLLDSSDFEPALWAAHVFFAAILFMPATIYHLSIALTNRNREKKYLVQILYGIGFLSALMSLHPSFFSGLRPNYFGLYPVASPLVLGAVLFMTAGFILSFMNLTTYHFSLIDPISRRQIRAFLLLFLILTWGFIDILVAYGGQIYPIGFLALLGFVLGMSCFQLSMLNRFMKQRSQQCETELSHIFAQLENTQERLLEAGKSSLFSNISAGILHQLSQPITAINGIAKFLKTEMEEKDKFYRPVSLIAEQATYMKQMVEGLMELLRHKTLKRDYVSVNQVIEKTIDLLTDELRIRRVDFHLHLGNDIPNVYLDSVHLQQIFMNIVINAMQALATLSQERPRRFDIFSQFEPEKKRVLVTFQDTGPGISSRNQNKIFEPFFSTKEKGAGIGLSLCRELLGEMQGTIEMESTPGKGATFFIKLPVQN